MLPTSPIRLENEDLLVDILPANGGKIASIRCQIDGTEFVLPGSRYDHTASFDCSAPFSASDRAGIDECLPTLAASGIDTPGGIAPDHGDYWRIPWNVLKQDADLVVLQAQGVSRPILFTRTIALIANRLRIRYALANVGTTNFLFHYAFHALLAVDPGDRIVLPPSVRRLHVYASKNRLTVGPVGWPIYRRANDYVKLSHVGSLSDDVADMLYTDQLNAGSCGLFRSRHQKGILIRFDAKQLPFLGLWMSYGGWPEGDVRRQYSIAFEPTVAPFGSLAESALANKAPMLMMGRPFAFEIELAVVGGRRPLVYDGFVQACDLKEG